MIDTHCHIDMYDSPLLIAQECENEGIITISMTNLPSHFELGYPHLRSFRKVRLALGMHPLRSEDHKKEFSGFINNLDKTSYIGEVGLDFSKEGIASKNVQIDTFIKVLKAVTGKNKILSIHSRNAEKEVLHFLKLYKIRAAIFHWYTGPESLIAEIADQGYYFSVNTAMINSKSGQLKIDKIPLANLLTESDGPYISLNGVQAKPQNVNLVHEYLAKKIGYTQLAIEEIIFQNFKGILKNLKEL